MSETTPLKQGSTTAAPSPNYVKILVPLTLTMAIGFGIAYGSLFVDKSSQELHAKKMETLKALDLQWLYLALLILGKTISLLNFVPVTYKKGLKGNIRSNPFFYEVKSGSNDEKKSKTEEKPMIAYKDDGPIGMYNRSNRSVQHMVENSGGFFAAIGPVGWLFPKQTLVLVSLFCIARIIHQQGYAKGYGSHALGFVLSMMSISTMEGLSLLAFLKGVGYM